VPWFLRFIAASAPVEAARAGGAGGGAVFARALDDTLDLLRETGLSDQISDEGCLSLYADEAEFKADRDHIEILERFGFPHEVIGRQAIKALEPELSDKIGMAVLLPAEPLDEGPLQAGAGAGRAVHRAGGPDRTGEVVGFTRSTRSARWC
jgi:D-amino-acid dehydrogenase